MLWGIVRVKRVAVLFENDDCLVLNKPAGLAVQGGKGVGVSLDFLLSDEWSPRPLLVHRLDKDTSGLILAAKTAAAAARFSALFAGEGRRLVRKQYLAVCAGRPEPEAGRIKTELEIRGKGKYAETGYRVVSVKAGFSLLELELGTGRMHQIRRHLALIGHPVLGDDKYGDFTLNKELRRTGGLRRLLLHSFRLIIRAEALGYPLDVLAPLPEYFSSFANPG
ncbi:MAG: RluA family pseudouridine synthase [Spirochaetaceae bacterium]|nr:RluA family pseudouridine synthase [Spirochaetaceae bacterium]